MVLSYANISLFHIVNVMRCKYMLSKYKSLSFNEHYRGHLPFTLSDRSMTITFNDGRKSVNKQWPSNESSTASEKFNFL